MLPVALNFEEDMTVDELVENQAVWHKSCHLKFNKERLKRASKKRSKGDITKCGNDGMKRYKHCSIDKMSCLFCQRKDGHLHEFRTLDADETVRHTATELQEAEIISRMEGGDLVAIDAKYHLQCLTEIRNRYRSLVRQREQEAESLSEEKKNKKQEYLWNYAHT